jgi:hypothetical protein
MLPNTKAKNPYFEAMSAALKESLEACQTVEQLAKTQGRDLRFTSSDVAAFALGVFKAKMEGKHA